MPGSVCFRVFYTSIKYVFKVEHMSKKYAQTCINTPEKYAFAVLHFEKMQV